MYRDGKFPGTCAGTKVAVVPGLAPSARTVAAAGAMEESWISNCNFAAPSPLRAGNVVPHQERPGYLKSLGEIKIQ